MSICSWFKKKPVVLEQTPIKPDLAWVGYLYDQIDRIYLKEFDDRAKDMARIHSKFKSMTRPERINVVCDLIRWLAYYESGWDPKSTSVDVGSKEDKDTWSISQYMTDLPTNWTVWLIGSIFMIVLLWGKE